MRERERAACVSEMDECEHWEERDIPILCLLEIECMHVCLSERERRVRVCKREK